MFLPFPSGSKWLQATKHQDRQWRRAKYAASVANNIACESAEEWVNTQLTNQDAEFRAGGKYAFNVQTSTRVMAAKITFQDQKVKPQKFNANEVQEKAR